jgi:hypothetical protein
MSHKPSLVSVFFFFATNYSDTYRLWVMAILHTKSCLRPLLLKVWHGPTHTSPDCSPNLHVDKIRCLEMCGECSSAPPPPPPTLPCLAKANPEMHDFLRLREAWGWTAGPRVLS